MIVECPECHGRYDDTYRWTICPHGTFAANDGQNNFAHHPESYIDAPDYPRKPDGTLDIEEMSRMIALKLKSSSEFAAECQSDIDNFFKPSPVFERLVKKTDDK